MPSYSAMRIPRIMARLNELANSRILAESNIVNSHNELVNLIHELSDRFVMLTVPLNASSTSTFLRPTEAYLTEFYNAHIRLVTATAGYLGHVTHAQKIIDEQATLEKQLTQIRAILPDEVEAKQQEGLDL